MSFGLVKLKSTNFEPDDRGYLYLKNIGVNTSRYNLVWFADDKTIELTSQILVKCKNSPNFASPVKGKINLCICNANTASILKFLASQGFTGGRGICMFIGGELFSIYVNDRFGSAAEPSNILNFIVDCIQQESVSMPVSAPTPAYIPPTSYAPTSAQIQMASPGASYSAPGSSSSTSRSYYSPNTGSSSSNMISTQPNSLSYLVENP